MRVFRFVFNFHENLINIVRTMSSINGFRMCVLVACRVGIWTIAGKKFTPIYLNKIFYLIHFASHFSTGTDIVVLVNTC